MQKVFLVSPETAAISAIKGVITNPMDMADDTNYIKAYMNVVVPDEFKVDDSSIIAPLEEEEKGSILKIPEALILSHYQLANHLVMR